jgi:Phage-related lysozyme (muraminidase)
MSPFFAIFITLIQLEEGCRLVAYKDKNGIWTIGWGYNMCAHEYEVDECEGVVWTQERADKELAASVQRVLEALDMHWPTWRKLDVVRQAVCVSGVYQLGSRKAEKFVNTIAALRAHDWELAAQQMLKSKWGTKDTPERVHRNAVMIRTGIFPEEINGHAFHPDVPSAADVVSACEQPAAPVLPAAGLRDAKAESPAVVRTVGEAPSGFWALTGDISKFLGKNPASYGVFGLFTMLVGNVRIQCKLWVFDRIYEFTDANILAAIVAAGVILFGIFRNRLPSGAGKALLSLGLVGLLALPGCTGFRLPQAGSEAAGLGADGPTVSETAQATPPSTLLARLKAGETWLWACVTRLRALGVEDAVLDSLREDILDMTRLTKEGAGEAARELFNKIWATAVALNEKQ